MLRPIVSTRRRLPEACVLAIVFTVVYHILPVSTIRRGSGELSLPNYASAKDSALRSSAGSYLCPDTVLADDVVVAIKTGAVEAAEKVPPQIQNSFRCAKDGNVLVFSDIEQDIGKYHTYDALNTVLDSVKDIYSKDFQIYFDQKRLWQNIGDVSSLKDVRHPDHPDDRAGWIVDKYKNLHVLEKAWQLKPDKAWYLFVDADTYIFWPTLIRWLKTLDPKKKAYFGSDASIGGAHFGHGGSGIVLSNAAMREVAVNHPGTARMWDSQVNRYCCGEIPFSHALKDYGVVLQDTWPMMSGENPTTIPFGPGTPEYWCGPAMSLHHITPKQFCELAAFEQGRFKPMEPLTHAEIFRKLVLGRLPSRREDWDNQAGDKGIFGLTGGVKVLRDTFEECAQACERDQKCLQFMHLNDTCSLGMSIRMGFERKPRDGSIWRSGWHKPRIAAWLAKQPTCSKIVFPLQYNPPSEFKANPIPHNRYNASQEVRQRDCGKLAFDLQELEHWPSKHGCVELPVTEDRRRGDSPMETCTICEVKSR